jgi:hypothetical protein
MTALDIAATPAAESAPPSRASKLEQKLERWSERLNPILVKEARQALKSKQFTITFSLLLSCAWAWSAIGVILQMPDIYYAPSGMMMLLGYYFILAVPLLLIVPFSAFRSLASEREDLTYELLSISTLTSRQIVTGKLGSAILQMMVYYSALAPCIAFTYLLRGVDVISLALLLAYTFCLSVLLSCSGLVFAGLARSRQWQTLISVLLLLGLIAVGVAWGAMIGSIVAAGVGDIPLDNIDFWIGQGAVFTALVTYVALLILVAAAQNSFASDNRSTRIRIAMVIQTLLFVAWSTYAWIRVAQPEMLAVLSIFAMLHWYVYGVLMTGESGKLSPRVRRQLPMSFFGRVFLTWFNPGSGTGFVFAVSNVVLLMSLVAGAVILQRELGVPSTAFVNTQTHDRVAVMAVLLVGYYIAYIGFSRLIVLLIPRRERFGLLLPVLINLLILLMGSALPFIFESWRRNYIDVRYTAVQATNWMWTLLETLDHGLGQPVVIVLVCLAAMLILVLNLMAVRVEIESVRVETPERVKQDDQLRSGQDIAGSGDAA